MYFIPVRNRLYSFGIKVPAWQRYLLTIGALVTVTAVWYFFVAMTLSQALTQTQIAVAQLKDKQTVLSTTQTSLEENAKSFAEKQKEFVALIRNVPAETIPVLSLAQQSGLQLTSYAPQPLSDHGWYATTKIICNLTGTFEQIVAFLAACSKSEQSLGVSSFSIAKREEGLQCMCALEMLTIKKEEQNEKKESMVRTCGMFVYTAST